MVFGLFLLTLTASSCVRMAWMETPTRPAVERIAVAPFDNQSGGDEAGNALGGLVARLVPFALAGSSDAFVYFTPSRAEAPVRRASQLVTGYLTREDGGARWTLHAQLRDMRSPRSLRAMVVSGAGATELADALAAQLGKPGFALTGQDVDALDAALAGKAAPEALAALKLSPGARALVSPLPAGVPRAAVLGQQSQALPADSETAYVAGLALLQTRQFPQAVEAFRRAQRADPTWPDLFNQSAFAEAFAGNQTEALSTIEKYSKLDSTANPLDSLGELYCLMGRYGDAERAFLQAYDKDPAFYGGATLRKAAEARRLAGGEAEAAKLFDRYASAQQARRPLMALERAQWDFAGGGKQKEALAAAEALATQTGASAAWTQVAVWRAWLGTSDAAGAARQALTAARTPGEQQSAVVALFATQPDASAEEWRARATKQFPPQVGLLARSALIYALMLRKHYAEAVPLLVEARTGTHPGQASAWQAMLAIALHESGQKEKALAEARMRPIPRTIGEGTWEFLMYPKIVELTRLASS